MHKFSNIPQPSNITKPVAIFRNQLGTEYGTNANVEHLYISHLFV